MYEWDNKIYKNAIYQIVIRDGHKELFYEVVAEESWDAAELTMAYTLYNYPVEHPNGLVCTYSDRLGYSNEDEQVKEEVYRDRNKEEYSNG